jgi:hypothetical protein
MKRKKHNEVIGGPATKKIQHKIPLKAARKEGRKEGRGGFAPPKSLS